LLFEEFVKDILRIIGLDDHRTFFKLVKRLIQLADEHNVKHIMAHTNWQFVIAVAAKLIYKRDFLISYTVHGYRHNYPIRSFFARILIGIILYFFADKVVTPSSFLKDKFWFLGKKNEIIFLGEDDSFFQENQHRDFSAAINFIFAGEFRAGKRQDMLIRVLKRYIEKSGNDNVFLYLPGKGERMQACKELARDYGLGNNVFFPGFINRTEMFALYRKCHFAFVPSNSETFGHCIVEPLLLGTIVITRHVGVADDIIRHGENGFFFEGEEDLLDLLLKIVPDAELCRQVSQNTLQNRAIFTWEDICRQHALLIYKHLLTDTIND